MARRYSILAVLTLLSLAVFVPSFAHALGIPTIVPLNCQGKDAATNCGICDIAQLARNVLNAAIYIAVLMSTVLFIWTGFRFLTAMTTGQSGKLADARRMFMNVFLGLVIILSAWLVVNTIMSLMVSGTASLPWNQLCSS